MNKLTILAIVLGLSFVGTAHAAEKTDSVKAKNPFGISQVDPTGRDQGKVPGVKDTHKTSKKRTAKVRESAK